MVVYFTEQRRSRDRKATGGGLSHAERQPRGRAVAFVGRPRRPWSNDPPRGGVVFPSGGAGGHPCRYNATRQFIWRWSRHAHPARPVDAGTKHRHGGGQCAVEARERRTGRARDRSQIPVLRRRRRCRHAPTPPRNLAGAPCPSPQRRADMHRWTRPHPLSAPPRITAQTQAHARRHPHRLIRPTPRRTVASREFQQRRAWSGPRERE
jgi:hypothetical protein